MSAATSKEELDKDEEKDDSELSPHMVKSLIISPSKSIPQPTQALSPIRKPKMTCSFQEFGGEEGSPEKYELTDTYNAGLQDTQELHVHSAAVVKRSEVEFPVQFHELQSNTDLKMPPSNWLQEHSSVRLPNTTHRHTDFSSFLMAHQFPDCIGEVDVVSDAENIKKLLKIPYNPKVHVSMMIHRVGKTLLIDDFDMYKYLLRQSEKEWQWLRKFFFEHVLESLAHKENVFVRPNKSRNVVQSRSLLSKFLYHSINENEEQQPSAPAEPVTESPVSVRRPSIVMTEVMPEPTLEDQLPQGSCQSFARNVVWNFEDLHMLIGTDLPIFGGGTHPCVSLRLRDMSKPINILTGIDYWLDNLMCNVPEVLMCYHLDGIVQKYELIKTEDLPHTSECQFSPRLVRDVAQNILAFLNSKATKEGHTYWLFKGKDDEIVKLYDLTSLCLEGGMHVDGTEQEAPTQDAGNPFTVPVAMLFYRVAKNMRATDDARNKGATIRALLKNALTLLDKKEYPKIVSSAHYMLSDLYVPQDIDPDSPVLSDMSDEDSEWSSMQGSDDEEDCDPRDSQSVTTAHSSSSIKVSSLCKAHVQRTQPTYYKAPPILGTLEERCMSALSHVTEALQCLQFSRSQEEHCGASTHDSPLSRSPQQQEPKMARPFQPIPMPYSPLKKDGEDEGKSLVLSKDNVVVNNQLTVSLLSQQYCVSSWWDKLQVLLLRKASLVYLVMSRANLTAQKYGLALRCVRFSLHAWQGMACKLGLDSGEIPIPCQALTLAGDIYYILSKAWGDVATHIDDYNTVTAVHEDLLTLLDSIIPAQDCRWTIKVPCDVEETMSLSALCFDRATLSADPDTALLLARRLGNVYNELGVLYMNQAAKLCEEKSIDFKGAEELWQRSAEVLSKGIDGFCRARDTSNMALLHSNTGRLLRLCAFYCVPREEVRQFSGQERHYYDQAIKAYQKALEILKSKKKSSEIWELVVWEYCTTLYTLASLLQDHPPHAVEEEEVLREVVELFNKALKYCDVKTPGARQPLYQYRAAVIYMRLAGIYHSKLRDGRGEGKNMRHLAELNYKKATLLFLQLENPIDILKVQLDQAVLIEDQLPGISNTQVLIRQHTAILHLLVDCIPALRLSQAASRPDSDQSSPSQADQLPDHHPQDQRGENNSRTRESSLGEEVKDRPGTGEDEEGQARTTELLEVVEKKLHTSLMALVKLFSTKTKKGSAQCPAGTADLGMVKQMYSLSLNTRSLPQSTHLLHCLTALAPFLTHLPPRR